MPTEPLEYNDELAYGTVGQIYDAYYQTARRGRRLSTDPVMQGTLVERMGRVPALLQSPHWRDRVRAQFIIASAQDSIPLPDAFPAIVMRGDSPFLMGLCPTFPQDNVWVAHPDRNVLDAVLPEYQAMWDSHTAQWGPNARRVFCVMLLDGVEISRLHRAESGPDEILRSAANAHGFFKYLRPELRPDDFNPDA